MQKNIKNSAPRIFQDAVICHVGIAVTNAQNTVKNAKFAGKVEFTVNILC